MSLIRYSADDSRSVVLRHQQTLVLYDPHSRQIILREASPTAPTDTPASQTCPYCNRPLHHSNSDEESAAGEPLGAPGMPHRVPSPLAESGFVDQHYFRMLDSSVPVEDSNSREPKREVPIPRLRREGTFGSSCDEVPSEDEGSNQHHGKGIKASAFSPGYFERFFVTEKELGRGGKGVVLLVRHVLDGVSLGNFACKRVPVGNNHEWLEKVLIEVQLLQRLSHPNLVSYRHVWLEDAKLSTFGPSVACAFILQQYCNSGDLHNYIMGPAKEPTKESLKERLRRRSRGQPELAEMFQPRKLPFEQILSFFRDIAQGLNHLHSNGFIHRDLKPQNCLLHATGIPGEELKVLVSDFGEVQVENQVRKSTGTTGTISYCAPEVLKRVAPGGAYENFTTKSDVFSLGMILHFMCFGKLPYVGADSVNEENEDLDALREEISAWQGLDERDKIRTDLPERLYHSLKTLINPDPKLRPSAEDILAGIKGNIGEEASPRRGSISTQKGGSAMDESQSLGFRRISPVADTPRSVTPTESIAAQLHQDYATLTSNGNSAPGRHPPAPSSKKTKLSQSSKPPGSPQPPPASDSGPRLGYLMILRPHLDPSNPTGPEPPAGYAWPRWRDRMAILEAIMLLRVVVFFIKIVSLSQPCLPAAPKASVYYPLIGLAILDFTAPSFSHTVFLAAVHIGVLILVRTFGGLCMY